MARKPDPEPVEAKCGSCNGNGGYWDYGNGTNRPKRWVSCPTCNGSGKA